MTTGVYIDHFIKKNISSGRDFLVKTLDERSGSRMLAMMSPQVMRSVWGRRKEEKMSEPGEKTTLLTSPGSEKGIETISLAISDCPGVGVGGGDGAPGKDCRQVESEKVKKNY